MNEKVLLAILMISGMGRKTAKKFIDKYAFDTEADEVYSSLLEFTESNKRVKLPSIEKFKDNIKKAENIISKHSELGIVSVPIYSEFYPQKLLLTNDPPVLLFAKGNIQLLNKENTAAIIGTREITNRGKRIAKRFGEVMAENDIAVVSGLAIGCDTYGHLGCLDAQGETIAVLPSSIDEIYPVENIELADRIASNKGLLLTEYYYGQKLHSGNFVDRDRLQAGLSKCVIVVETGVIGGTMHTVQYTLKYGRKLACFYDERNYIGMPQMNGNKKLISDEVAMPLSEKEDLKELIEDLKSFDIENTEAGLDVQLSLDDL